MIGRFLKIINRKSKKENSWKKEEISEFEKNALKSISSYHEETSDKFKVIYLFDSESNWMWSRLMLSVAYCDPIIQSYY